MIKHTKPNETIKKRARVGFSLIELSIVVLIIGILIAGVTQGSRLVNEAKIKSVRAVTKSSGVSSIEGIALWLDATAEEGFITSIEDGDAVSIWSDINPQSTNKNNAFQSIVASQPQYVARGINNLPSLKFDGGDDWINLADTLLTDPGNWTTFVVSQRLDTAVSTVSILATSSAARYYINSTLTDTRISLGNTSAGGVLLTNGLKPSLIALYSSGNIFTATGVTTNSYNVVSNINAVYTTTGVNGLNLGSYNDGANSWFNGYISEVIMFNRPLKQSEQADVRDYLEKKWGLYRY
jgi:prepilin-type N-terminal cleavage/methylation domain-containing protein